MVSRRDLPLQHLQSHPVCLALNFLEMAKPKSQVNLLLYCYKRFYFVFSHIWSAQLSYKILFIAFVMVLLVLNMSSFIGTAGEVFSREAEGQHSQDQLPNVEKFSSIGRNSLNLDIFSPLNDGKITDVASFAFFMYCPVYCHFMVPKCAFPSSLQDSKHMVLVILQLQEMVIMFNYIWQSSRDYEYAV